jgi:ABC-type transporter Mla maintaining outer membrane lipid asymmetry ATPase subunit MlaF
MYNENTIIELQSVSASMGEINILFDISIAFQKGVFSVIMGEAGIERSVLLKTCAGLIQPDSGTILYNGIKMSKFTKAQEMQFRASSGFIFQDAALWSDTTILNNVAMPLRLHKLQMKNAEIDALVKKTLHQLGYKEGINSRPADLSVTGQKLASIARAIVHEPSLVFMEDPISNLDEDAIEKVYHCFNDLQKKGCTIILASNNSELAYKYADMIGLLKSGAIAAFGNYEETVEKMEGELSTAFARLKAKGTRNRIKVE